MTGPHIAFGSLRLSALLGPILPRIKKYILDSVEYNVKESHVTRIIGRIYICIRFSFVFEH